MVTKKETQELAVVERRDEIMENAMTIKSFVEQRKLINEAISSVMVRGKDYGRPTGTDKDVLYQPGAQKLNVLFRLSPEFTSTETYGENGHLTVKSYCAIRHVPTGKVLATGEGMCSTREKKYAKRKENGRVVDNANLPDLWNTILKMSNKRALIAGVLNATAAGDTFTQDLEDLLVMPDQEEEVKQTEVKVKETPAEKPSDPPAQSKHDEKKANGYAPDAPMVWRGSVTDVEEMALPDKRPCWVLTGDGAVPFKTLEVAHVAAARDFKIVSIEYHKNAKGTLVIDSVKEAK
jgi:hypothetical protein